MLCVDFFNFPAKKESLNNRNRIILANAHLLESDKGKNQYPLKSIIPALSRENILADIFMYGIALRNMYAPRTPPKRGWYFLMLRWNPAHKCFRQFFVFLAAECAVPVNNVATDCESVCGGFLIPEPYRWSRLLQLPVLFGGGRLHRNWLPWCRVLC